MSDLKNSRPQPWSSADPGELQKIRGVCLDIDETLSTRGKLTAEAYSALWSLKDAGFIVIPITGRPAGWCDHFARFWPVDAVVGENGAFTFYMEDGHRKRLDTPGATPEAKSRLHGLEESIRAKFPRAKCASDQAYREFDLAIDICEDVPAWSRSEIDELLKLCEDQGAHAKLSSIHVNAWFGDYDKRRGLETYLAHIASAAGGSTPKQMISTDELLFIGDSPNDEPLFASFKNSVGVANLKDYLDRLTNPPRWITQSQSGSGFAEMARTLTRLKKST